MNTNFYYAGFIPIEGIIAVLFPDFPRWNTQGTTMEQAFSRAREAISSYIKELISENYAIPLPISNDIAFFKLKNILVKL